MLSLAYTASLTAQWNIKVGYAGGFMKAPVLNGVVDKFNNKYPNFEDKFETFKSIHGLEIGLRYRLRTVGFEATWNSMSARSDFVGKSPGSNSNFQDKWFMSMTEYSIGLENYIGNFGYGATLGYRTFRMKTDITGATRKKRVVVEESGLASKFYLLYQVAGNKVGIAFKPYVQFPLQELDISNFDQDLNVQLDDAYNAEKPQLEKFFMYGISIVLYNGKQY